MVDRFCLYSNDHSAKVLPKVWIRETRIGPEPFAFGQFPEDPVKRLILNAMT